MAKGARVSFQVPLNVERITPCPKDLRWPYRVTIPIALHLQLATQRVQLPFLVDTNTDVSVLPRSMVDDVLTALGPLGAPRVRLDGTGLSPHPLEGRLTNPLQVEFQLCPSRLFSLQFLVADNVPPLQYGLLSLRDIHRYFQLQMGGQQVAYAPVIVSGYVRFTTL